MKLVELDSKCSNKQIINFILGHYIDKGGIDHIKAYYIAL